MRPPILDGWYAGLAGSRSFPDWLADRPRPLRRATERAGFVHGLVLLALSFRAEAVAAVNVAGRGWQTLVLGRALLGRRRKLVALEFIRMPPANPRHRLWLAIEPWLLRRALRTAHVLTPEEPGIYARHYGIPEHRFVYVPWPWRRLPAAGPPPPLAPGGPVVCGGRMFCDWRTLFAAARGADWPLVAVCSEADLPGVRALAAGTTAEVRHALPPDEFRALLESASVCALVMVEGGVSQGHARLRDAADTGRPVIATDTLAMRSYVEPGETALLVPEGDPAALRSAIDALRADPERASRIRDAARARSQRWTAERYLAGIRALIAGETPVVPDEDAIVNS